MDRSVDEYDHRISLICFTDDSVNIKTWWITEDRYALLSAALGDPEVDSFYPRAYIDAAHDAVLQDGIHILKEEAEEDDSGTGE